MQSGKRADTLLELQRPSMKSTHSQIRLDWGSACPRMFPPSAVFKAKDFFNDKFVCVKAPDANDPRPSGQLVWGLRHNQLVLQARKLEEQPNAPWWELYILQDVRCSLLQVLSVLCSHEIMAVWANFFCSLLRNLKSLI